MKQVVLSLIVATLSLTATAQDLVKNGSFEEVSKKIKEKGQLANAIGWENVTATKADLYMPKAGEEVGTPYNMYGKEKAMKGENYAGFVGFVGKDKAPRSYVATKLIREMAVGEKYCVRFYVSLSDLSKYGSSDIGAILTEKPIDMAETTENVMMNTHIRHSRNKVMRQQIYWEPICGVYTAKGGERFLTIGNFQSTSEVNITKVKRAAEFKTPQKDNSYYYLDNVSVIPYSDDECICERKEFNDTPTTIESSMESNTVAEVKKTIESTQLRFAEGETTITPEMEEELRALAEFFAFDSDLKVEITGHISANERKLSKKNPKLILSSINRAKNIQGYLVNILKIDKFRLTIKDAKDTKPVISSEKDNNPANQSTTLKVIIM